MSIHFVQVRTALSMSKHQLNCLFEEIFTIFHANLITQLPMTQTNKNTSFRHQMSQYKNLT
jgi:hypothetical protein